MGSTGLAYAGKQLVEDHPHIHGEHKMSIPAAFSHAGSPPYTWGALKSPFIKLILKGITPIYMGSTKCQFQLRLVMQDHPHIHGEHSNPHLSSSSLRGSPPYTWGAPLKRSPPPLRPRITPIYMGSTSTITFGNKIFRDHPHIHGEHSRERADTFDCCGITPIYMGSTIVSRFLARCTRDHPHIHGEHAKLKYLA